MVSILPNRTQKYAHLPVEKNQIKKFANNYTDPYLLTWDHKLYQFKGEWRLVQMNVLDIIYNGFDIGMITKSFYFYSIGVDIQFQ